jgi:hypothetical protein
MKRLKSLLIVFFATFACSFATTATAVEDWYLYVALNGLGNTNVVSDDVACYAPDGSVAWNYEAPNPTTGEFEWNGLAYNPVVKTVVAVSPTLNSIWQFDRYRGRIISGLGNPPFGLVNVVSVAIGPDGHVYVGNETDDAADQGIQRFDGLTLTPFGVKFSSIATRGITFGPDGNLYACNNNANNPTGARVFQIDGTTGAFIDDYTDPLGSQLAAPLWHEGDLFVAQASSNRILRITDTGGTVTEFVTPGDGGLFSPHGFAFTPDGDLLVTSYGFQAGNPGGTNSIKRFNGTTGAFVGDFTTLPLDSAPGEVALEIVPQPDPANNFEVIVCTDGGDTPPTSEEVVQKIDSSGNVTLTFDDPNPIGHLRWTGIALGSDTNVYVSSLGLHDVYRWNLDGTFIDVFTAGTTNLNQSDDLTFDPTGSNLLVGCQSSTENLFGVVRFDGASGAFIDRFADIFAVTGCAFGPSSFDQNSAKNLYVTRTNGQVPIYHGTTGAFLGLFNDLADPIASNLGPFVREPKAHDGYIYVAQGARILRFNPEPSGNLPGHLLEPEFVVSGAGGMTVAQGFDWDPDGNLLVASVGATNGVRKFHGRTGEYLGMFAELASTSWPNDVVVREFAIPVTRPELGISVVSNLTIEVNFDSESGKTYDLQLEANLPAGTWTNDPTNEDIAGTGTNVVRTINSSGDAQNIRVKTD